MSQRGPEQDVACALQQEVWREVRRMFETCREQEGLTQAELARRIGLQRERVHYWLGDPGRMTLKAAARLLAGMDARLECRSHFIASDHASPALKGRASLPNERQSRRT